VKTLSKSPAPILIQKIHPMTVSQTLTLFATALALAAPCCAQNSTAPAQPAASAAPEFDVISIKPAKAGATGANSSFDNATYTAANETLGEIIQYDAYGITAPRILGIPPALEKARFDIEAKIDPVEYARMQALPGAQRTEQFQLQVRQLLAERFKLVVHTETRELPVYALVVAKGSPKLKAAQKPDSNSGRSRTGYLNGEGMTMEHLANSLTRTSSAELGRLVIDKTGLTGKYDLTLRWTPDTGNPPMLNGEPDTSAPSIFTAIQEQLGLKLESTKGPVSVLVIDHAELPTLN
jgi:uncharacterized protein (TIGR03435 family)